VMSIRTLTQRSYVTKGRTAAAFESNPAWGRTTASLHVPGRARDNPAARSIGRWCGQRCLGSKAYRREAVQNAGPRTSSSLPRGKRLCCAALPAPRNVPQTQPLFPATNQTVMLAEQN
jgi:hypothetical protein